MTPRERVSRALRHESTDRVPFFMWFHPDTAKRLAETLAIRPSQVAQAFGNDIRQAWVNNNHAMEGIVHECEGEGHTDYWGIRWEKRGSFNQVTHFPLEHADPAAVRDYTFPVERVPELMRNMEPLRTDSAAHFIGVDVSPCVFEMYWRLRGLDRALLDMAEDETFAEIMLARCADFSVLLSVWACESFPVDWLWLGDDVAGQTAMIMSPAQWRSIIKPHLSRIAEIGLRHGLPVAYHCCGALRPIIPDLIDIGISVLNPIQCNCPGMEASELKRAFGKDLTFMGGIDTQGLLPHGTPREVYDSTRRLVDTMTADGGGYILAASHTIPPETPLENIYALYQAAGLGQDHIMERAAALRGET